MGFSSLAISVESLQQRRSPGARRFVTLPITIGLRNAIPKISCQSNATGVTLLWTSKSREIADIIDSYQIIVDEEKYGYPISPNDEPRAQINLKSGIHQCYLEVQPKDKNEEVFRSNVLSINIATQPAKPYDNGSSISVPKQVDDVDIPVPKLNIQKVSSSSIRANWYLDRAIPEYLTFAMYEVRVRGFDFPDDITSNDSLHIDGFIEHIWNVKDAPLEIAGISDFQEYTIYVKALFHLRGSSDTKYYIKRSNEVKTTKVDSLIDLLTRPLLKVERLGPQAATLSWKLANTVDPALVKGYRIIINSKPTEILTPDQHNYEVRNLKPDTQSEIQVSVTSHPDFIDQKVSEPIRIICPPRPQAPQIVALKADKPFSISIKWESKGKDRDEVASYKLFLDDKLHGEIPANGRQSFKYDFNNLKADVAYSIYIKSIIGQKRVDGYTYQCDCESNLSNELTLNCAAPPRGTPIRLERMSSHSVEIAWDAPFEYDGDVKLTGYQILKDGRVIGKPLPVDKRQTTIRDLQSGNRFTLQVLPLTDQTGAIQLRLGEEYDDKRHGHFIPGPKLEVEFTDIVRPPEKIWVENITGYTALVCWSPIDRSSSSHIQPENYKLTIWNNKEWTRDKPLAISLPKENTSALLKDLQSDTTYEFHLESYRKRSHHETNVPFLVSVISEIKRFKTGSPPEAPNRLALITSTNTSARFEFDEFIEHNAEIVALRVICQPISDERNAKEIVMDLTPDANEFIVSGLVERTNYTATIYAITNEYLQESSCRDISQLSKRLKTSPWLVSKSVDFMTSGFEPARDIKFLHADMKMIKLEWKLPEAYGSTKVVDQVLRWSLQENGQEKQMDLDQTTKIATIPGPLVSGVYQVNIDSIFSVKINLEDEASEANRKHVTLTTTKSIRIRFHVPQSCERPEIYVIGYTTNTIDLKWNKPNLFNIIDHPEKLGEKLKIQRSLVGYQINVNGDKYDTLNGEKRQCQLTECRPGEEYTVQLVAKTVVQNEPTNAMYADDNENTEKPDETVSQKKTIRTLRSTDTLRSFQANFEFNNTDEQNGKTEERTGMSSLGKINVNWDISNTRNISHFILKWRNSKALRAQEQIVPSNDTTFTIQIDEEKCYCMIEIVVVMNDSSRHEYESLAVPIPGSPDAPKLWLVKSTDTNFVVGWSEPKIYGIPLIGYELYIEGKKSGDIIEASLHRAEIPSRINRTYQVTVCAVTNNLQRFRSPMSETLSVITTPTTNLVPTIYYNNDDGSSTSFDRNVARVIPLQIDSINEEKLYLDWTSFLPTKVIRAYYVQYTCLNDGEVQTMKVSKRFRHTILHGLRPGFTYGITIMAVDKNGAVLYTSDKSTIQMSAPPNAPIVAISERELERVTLEWRRSQAYGGVAVVGYKVFVNNRLAAILGPESFSYTLTNGIPCNIYTVQVQALSNDKKMSGPMSREIKFAWPGIKPGTFRRIDDGQTGNIIVTWEHPQIEDEAEKLLQFKLFSQNLNTNIITSHGEFDPTIHQATIHDLGTGKYQLWLEIVSRKYIARTRPIVVVNGRFNSLLNRQASFDSAKCFAKNPKRFRSPNLTSATPPLRYSQHS